MQKFLFKNALLFLIGSVAGYITYEYVSAKDLDKVVAILQNVSAMIFTIMGLWVAFIYPAALSAITDPDRVSMIEGSQKTRRLESLVLVILSSAFVMICLLAYVLVFMLFSNHGFVLKNSDFFKAAAIAFITFLSLVQTRAVVSVMIANVSFVNDLHKKVNDSELHDDL